MKEESGKEIPVEVRGISLISTLKYMESTFPKDELSAFLDSVDRRYREIIADINKGGWYPFEVQRLMREAIVRQSDSPDPSKAILDAYLVATDYEISTFLQGLLSFLPVKLVVGRAAALWSKYYRPGLMRSITLGEKQVALELSEFPSDPLFCPTVEAWLTNAAKYQRLKGVRVAETACIHRGDDVCRWEVVWK